MILNQNMSYEEIGRKYGCSGSNIKKVAIKIGINLPQRRKINESETFNKGTEQKYYCLNCGKLLNQGTGSNYTPKKFKKDILQEQNGICGCKPEWNNKPLVFILDHIDGNASNNARSNLRCICPNCDSQLDTYKSKNKNGARSYYRYHKFDEKTKIGK